MNIYLYMLQDFLEQLLQVKQHILGFFKSLIKALNATIIKTKIKRDRNIDKKFNPENNISILLKMKVIK